MKCEKLKQHKEWLLIIPLLLLVCVGIGAIVYFSVVFPKKGASAVGTTCIPTSTTPAKLNAHPNTSTATPIGKFILFPSFGGTVDCVI